MCPSFQATLDEMYSTRGRANLLRAMISDGFDTPEMAVQAVKEALDKCLACKGCKAECPSAVDMAKLKYEFYQHYHSLPGHPRPLRDYLFGYILQVSKLGHHFAPLVNLLLSADRLAGLRERVLRISKFRKLPLLAGDTIHRHARHYFDNKREPDCLLLSDAFNEYFYPQIGVDALNILKAAGCNVKLLSTIGTGRTLISKGFLVQAKRHAQKLINEINRIDPNGKLPIVGLEPSEIYTLKDEFVDFFRSNKQVNLIAERAFMIDEFLLRPDTDRLSGSSWLNSININDDNRTEVLLHGHCYQKAQSLAKDGLPIGVTATEAMLQAAGFSVKIIDDGCCGMAGAFGYETEHYDLSMQVGKLSLIPTIKKSSNSIIATPGISCRSQIEDGTGRKVFHPISLVAQRWAKVNGGVNLRNILSTRSY